MSKIKTLSPSTDRRWARALVVIALACAGAGAHAATEVQVTTANIIDYEFDWGRDGVNCPSCNRGAGNSRLAFVDSNKQLWVASVDPATGNFLPANGMGQLVDSRAAPAPVYLNGPEWVRSALGSQIVFTRYQPGMIPSNQSAGLATATDGGNGTWSVTMLDSSLGKVNPMGSTDPTDAQPTLHYQNTSTSYAYSRVENVSSSELPITVSGQGDASSFRRSVDGMDKIVVSGKASNGYYQIFLYDPVTGVSEQVTHEKVNLKGAAMWQAPEFNGDYAMVAVQNGVAIVIYRRTANGDGTYTWNKVIKRQLPSATPYAWSPEFFIHNGKSYVFFQMNTSSNWNDYTKPNLLAMMGITDDNSQIQKLVASGAKSRARTDPEYFITAQGPFIYYNRYAYDGTTLTSEGIWRVDTGLGPAVAPTVGTNVSKKAK